MKIPSQVERLLKNNMREVKLADAHQLYSSALADWKIKLKLKSVEASFLMVKLCMLGLRDKSWCHCSYSVFEPLPTLVLVSAPPLNPWRPLPPWCNSGAPSTHLAPPPLHHLSALWPGNRSGSLGVVWLYSNKLVGYRIFQLRWCKIDSYIQG